MSLKLFARAFITASLCSFSAQAWAQTSDGAATPNQWVTLKTVQSYGQGFSDRRQANKEYGETLFTNSTTEPGIFFSCLDKKFRVGVVYKAQPMFAAFSDMEISGISGAGRFAPTAASLAYVSAKFGGQKKTPLGRWLYFEDEAAALSRDNEAARQIYNAVVRGQNIDVTIRANNHATLVYPKIDDTFANFGASCGIGRQGAAR